MHIREDQVIATLFSHRKLATMGCESPERRQRSNEVVTASGGARNCRPAGGINFCHMSDLSRLARIQT